MLRKKQAESGESNQNSKEKNTVDVKELIKQELNE